MAGARPNFMKIAPVLNELKKYPALFDPVFVHTGQHYDDRMSRVFLEELALPLPDVDLGVGSGTHAVQTSRVMTAFEKTVLKRKPELVLVVGDVNSTLACALVAAKLHIPVAHVEAGLRSNDRSMPEEINRILTDQISDILFTTCRDGDMNLKKEGIPPDKIHLVGNTMIQSLLQVQPGLEKRSIHRDLNVTKKEYILVTLHRPSNVDHEATFRSILGALRHLQTRATILFPAHPRTQKQIHAFGFGSQVENNGRFRILDALGYMDFLALQKYAGLVLTDSGGVQEETTFFGVPCLTLRENTERPVTITQGTNILVGTDPAAIIRESERVLDGRMKKGSIPRYWDDRVAGRMADVLIRFFS